MEITGRLILILPELRGESARGPWVRGGFVIETDGEYPRQVAFVTMGEDRLAMVKATALNSQVSVTFNLESREYQGRWYTDARCIRIQNIVPGQMPPAAAGYGYGAAPQQPMAAAIPQQPAAQQPAFGAAPMQPTFASAPNDSEDLPF